MRSSAKLVLLLAVFASSAHCSKKKKSGDGPEVALSTYAQGPSEPQPEPKPGAEAIEGFIRPELLQNPGNFRSTTATEIAATISGHSYFYRTSLAVGGATGCLGQLLANNKYTVKDSKVSAKFFEDNAISCFQSEPAFSALRITKASVNFQHEFICPEGDLKRFSDTSIASAVSIAKPKECVSEIYNMTAVISATIVKGGNTNLVTRTVHIARIGAGQVTSPGKSTAAAALALTDDDESKDEEDKKKKEGVMGCVYAADGETDTSSGCQWISSTTDYWVPAVYPDNQYIQIVDEDLKIKAPSEGPYYAGGSMAFLINGWKGSMTYTAPSEQPTWKASYGLGNFASGTFGTSVAKSTSNASSAATGATSSLKLSDEAQGGTWGFLDLASKALSSPFNVRD